MRSWARPIHVAILIVLLIILGHRLYTRGTGLRLGARASTIEGPHATEARWAAAQILTDLAEMIRYAHDPGTRPGRIGVEVADGPPGSTLTLHARVTVGRQTIEVPVDLGRGVWSTETYRPVAERFLVTLASDAARAGRRASADEGLALRLLEADAAGLERESESLGDALGRRMLDPRLHEGAALLLTAFGLRETAGRLGDDRPQLVRLLAHLALAGALRADDRPSFSGRAAAVFADHLAGRGRVAAAAATRLGEGGSSAEQAWARVLQLRITEDDRGHPMPATLVERLERFRARVRTIGTGTLLAEIDELGKGEADWGRLAEHGIGGVDVGHAYTVPGLEREIRELAAVWAVSHGGQRPPDPIAALDGSALGCLTAGGPRPLGWGLWSRFFERHLVANAERVDTFSRHSFGDVAGAEAAGAVFDQRLGRLPLYAAATSLRTRGVANGDADLRLIDKAIRSTIRRPELVPAALWSWLEYAQQYEPVAVGMPSAAAWFARPAPETAALDVARRLEGVGHRLDGAALEALWQASPYDFDLARLVLERRYGPGRTPQQIRHVFGARFAFDLRAADFAEQTLTDAGERVELRRGTCAIDPERCFMLGWALVEAKREAEAAAAFERALADEHARPIALSNHASWLVDYYRRTGRVRRAFALANAAAGVGSARGLYTRAWLYERTDYLDEAEQDYLAIAERYDAPQDVVAFYFRMARGRKIAKYEPSLQRWAAFTFPNGLVAVSEADATGAPQHAVQVMKDTELSRRQGLRAGDLIVGLDGWRVESLRQFETIRAFAEDEAPLRLVVWRGARVEVTASGPNRRLGVDLRSYPVQGWAEP